MPGWLIVTSYKHREVEEWYYVPQGEALLIVAHFWTLLYLRVVLQGVQKAGPEVGASFKRAEPILWHKWVTLSKEPRPATCQWPGISLWNPDTCHTRPTLPLHSVHNPIPSLPLRPPVTQQSLKKVDSNERTDSKRVRCTMTKRISTTLQLYFTDRDLSNECFKNNQSPAHSRLDPFFPSVSFHHQSCPQVMPTRDCYRIPEVPASGYPTEPPWGLRGKLDVQRTINNEKKRRIKRKGKKKCGRSSIGQ